MQSTLEKLVNRIEMIEEKTIKLENNVETIFEQLHEVKRSQYQLHNEINVLQHQGTSRQFSARTDTQCYQKRRFYLGHRATLDDFSSQPYVVYHWDQKKCHIVANFNDMRTKIKAMSEFKSNQPITVEDVCEGLSPESPFRGKKVFLKKLFTRNNEMLLHETRQHTNYFLFVWESNGRILARRTSTSPPIFIRSSEHLKDLLTTLSTVNGENAQMETSQTRA